MTKKQPSIGILRPTWRVCVSNRSTHQFSLGGLLAVCGPQFHLLAPPGLTLTTVCLDDVPLTFGVIPSGDPAFDPQSPKDADRVLIKVKAFSCDYRDKALIFRALHTNPAYTFKAIGSEFVAEVKAVGANVGDLKPGDRVMADSHYVDGRPYDGLPTNLASREFLILYRHKLALIPDTMSDEVAASFSLGAQTAHSLVRKLGAGSGDSVLVTAARSNTSLFALQVLRRFGVNAYVTTTSADFDDRFRALGVKGLFYLEPGAKGLSDHPQLIQISADLGGFDGILDPFANLHLPHILQYLKPGGRYITCGAQHNFGPNGQPEDARIYAEALSTAMYRNLSLIGNCVGLTEDLQRGLADYAQGDLDAIVDSVFEGDQVGPFINRTFNDPERFGKVVFRYI
jgi:NADPH:quinone reductase-like Zn-dependent oxidoreductase